MQQHEALPPGSADTDIAIVGMAGRFPGAPDIEAFWANLRDGVESVTWLTDEQLRAAGVPDELIADPQYVKAAYPVPGMEEFDAGFFGFAPREASIMDPQQRHFLELAWAALEHAGHDPARFPGSVGVYAGCGSSAYLMFNLLTNPELVQSTGFFLLRHTGNDKDFLATRVSYLMNLRGPSVNVQTACSTSLVAIHSAVQSLLNHECDLALAGGSTFKQPHAVGYRYEEGEIMSPDGHCRSFDEQAEGTIFGSGAGVVVLRRLADAIRDGDTIHAVIKGSAINNDGSQKVGFLAPSVDGQAAVIEEALRLADVAPDEVQYVECHGTATPVGDPIEVAALTQAYRSAGTERNGYCAIGTVKSNIGHLDTAAGVAGLIKTVQALKHKEIPASLHYTAPNPSIDFERSPFFVNASRRAWETAGGPRRAGVSALGAGGTNAHVILEEAPVLPPSDAGRTAQLYVLSAKTPAALDAQAANIATCLETADMPAADIAFTLAAGRQPFAHRRAVVATSKHEAAALLRANDAKKVAAGTVTDRTRTVAFMFAGGGAQHPGMGEDLYRTESVYRAAVDECIALLQPTLDWDLAGLLFPAADKREACAVEMERPSRSLPCLFITQYAMARQCMAWGLEPEAMIGHSMGEYTAAHLAGVFSLRDALSLVTLRGRLFETVPAGGMLSVALAADELMPRLPSSLSIAAVNAPDLCVASGPLDALEALERALEADEIDCRRVRINIAAHSSMLEPILAEFGAFLRGITLSAPQRRFVSNVSGTWITEAEATTPEYWVRHLRQTVRFADGVGVLLQDEGRVLVEVGPGRTLATLASLHGARRADQPTIATMRHPDEAVHDVAHALGALGRCWVAGVPLDSAALWQGERRRRVPLPTYPFEHQSYFIAPGKPTLAAPTLAKRADVGSWFHAPAWVRTPLAVNRHTASTTRWLVVHDRDGLGAALATRLRAAHGTDAVISVLPDQGWGQDDAQTFRVNPVDAEQVAQLLRALAVAGGVPTRIVHALNVDAPEERTSEVEDRAFFSLLALLQGVAAEGIEEPLQLDVITAGAHAIGGEPMLDPRRALVLGPVRVASREFPNVRARQIDVAIGGGVEAVLLSLLAELNVTADVPRVVAWRGATRFVQQFASAPLASAGDNAPWCEDGAVCLVTGGLGGLGLLVAQELARTARVRLVLVGRTPLPPRAAWPAALAAGGTDAERIRGVEAIEALGAEVLVLAGDVSDAAQMMRVVAEAKARFGGITHLLHAAGVIDDALIPLKERTSAARVLAPKVSGTLALQEALAGHPLQRIIVFSSRGAVAGVAGQVDYTAASAFLDAWADAQAAFGAQALSIDWSAWQGVGLAAALTAPARSQGRATAHPLLERCVRDTDGEVEYRTLLSPSTHWLLDGHRIRGGESLIPGTGYLELVRAAAAERAPASHEQLELRDVFFITPFMVRDGETRELRLTLEGTDEREVVIEGRAGGAGSWDEHARAMVSPLTGERPAPVDLAAIRARCSVRQVAFSGREEREHLVLGERWSNIRALDYGTTEALATLELPDVFAADCATYPLHPALLDVATACAQALIPGFDGTRDFYIPVSYGRVRLWAPLEPRSCSHIRLQPGAEGQDTAVYDVSVYAADGRLLVDIADFTMMKVKDRVRVGHDGAGSASSSSPMPLQMQAAITPDEGLEAFRRLAAAGATGQVVVSPQDLGAYLAALDAPPPAPAVPERIAPTAPAVDTSEVEAVLGTHEAVHTVVVTAHRERAGGMRVTAFVVFELGEQATVSEVRRYLRGKVPEELVPQHLVELDELPLAPDGAVDRSALPDPFAGQDDMVGPRSEMEHTIAKIWMELLGVAKLSVYDNFLDVGGHSLLAMRAVSRIAKQTGVRLNPSVMTLHTLEQIAAECAEKAVVSGAAR